jgi:hypothetical protein
MMATQLDQFSLLFVLRGEALQRRVHFQQVIVLHGHRNLHFLKIHPQLAAAAAQCAFAPGVVNQNAAHRLGRRPEKMRPAVPFLIFLAAEAQPRFMDQRGGLNVWPGFSCASLNAASRRNSS